MLEIFTGSKEDAIAIIKNDHTKVKKLFEEFEQANNLREKKAIAAQAIQELKIHAEIEEKIFYPAVRKGVEKDLMNEADEEHHVAKLLIAELDQMDGSEDHWEAKFTVLSENIRHHIKEEEGEMLPQAREENIDFESLGRKLLAMKQQLKVNGVPPSDEEKLMRRTKAKDDSPAKAARAKPSLKVGAKASARKSTGSYSSGSRGAKQPAANRKSRTASKRRKG